MDLTTFRHNWEAIPSARKVHARYEISPHDGGALLCYYQVVTTDRPIGWLGIRLVRWQLHRFRDRLTAFLREQERQRKTPGAAR